MSEPNILLESWSPVCEIQAFVEETDRNCYFYLWFYPNSERSYLRECWICNTAPAGAEIDVRAMEEGRAPSMPSEFVAHDQDFFEKDYWGQVQEMHMEALEEFFGPHQKYYGIDGGKFPPKALMTGERDGVCYGITAGVSMVPLPKIEQYYQEETGKFRRIELGFASVGCGAEEQMRMYSFLSSLSAYPWQEISWLGHGHTIPCRALEGYSAVWLLNSRLVPEISAPVYKEFMGEPVNLLWVVPLREEEYQRLVEQGTEEVLKCRSDELSEIHIFRR